VKGVEGISCARRAASARASTGALARSAAAACRRSSPEFGRLGVGWMALVAAELVGANSGLGFLISDSRTVLRTDYVIVGMATIGVVGLAIDRTIRTIVQRTLPCRGNSADERRAIKEVSKIFSSTEKDETR